MDRNLIIKLTLYAVAAIVCLSLAPVLFNIQPILLLIFLAAIVAILISRIPKNKNQNNEKNI